MNNSKLVLTTSIILFIFGVITTILTLGNLEIDIANFLQNYEFMNYIFLSILALILIYFIVIGVTSYKTQEKIKREKELVNNVRLDSLTQIFNFEYFVGLLQRMENPFSFVMLDIDDFKSINEKFDSVIGDLVLKVIAKSIKDNIRLSDIVARYQGDAFLIILPGCSPRSAKQLMNQIRLYIKENNDLAEKEINLSTSIGIYYVEGKEEPESIFRKGVEALMKAKSDPEQKVYLYSELEETTTS